MEVERTTSRRVGESFAEKKPSVQNRNYFYSPLVLGRHYRQDGS